MEYFNSSVSNLELPGLVLGHKRIPALIQLTFSFADARFLQTFVIPDLGPRSLRDQPCLAVLTLEERGVGIFWKATRRRIIGVRAIITSAPFCKHVSFRTARQRERKISPELNNYTICYAISPWGSRVRWPGKSIGEPLVNQFYAPIARHSWL